MGRRAFFTGHFFVMVFFVLGKIQCRGEAVVKKKQFAIIGGDVLVVIGHKMDPYRFGEEGTQW